MLKKSSFARFLSLVFDLKKECGILAGSCLARIASIEILALARDPFLFIRSMHL